MFRFHLARELGWSVAEVETRMSHRELMEWAVFFKIEAEKRQEADLDAKLEARHARRR